jgi:hypothetical protein
VYGLAFLLLCLCVWSLWSRLGRGDVDDVDEILSAIARVGPTKFLRQQSAFAGGFPSRFNRSFSHARCWHDTRSHAGETTCVPGAYVIGSKKSGTSSLRASLLDLPSVFAPKSVKEPTWWTSRRAFDYPRNSSTFRWYVDVYRPVTEEWMNKTHGRGERAIRVNARSMNLCMPGVILDCTPDMFHATPDLPFVLRAFDPSAKLLLILRPPHERAFSDYRMMNKGTIMAANAADLFHVAITEYLARPDLRCMPECAFDVEYRVTLREYGDPQLGFYAFFLRRWLRAGWQAATVRSSAHRRALADVLVLASNELDDADALVTAARHIGAQNVTRAQLMVEHRNVDAMTGDVRMHNQTRRLLEDYFAASNAQLYDLLGVDFRRV